MKLKQVIFRSVFACLLIAAKIWTDLPWPVFILIAVALLLDPWVSPWLDRIKPIWQAIAIVVFGLLLELGWKGSHFGASFGDLAAPIVWGVFQFFSARGRLKGYDTMNSDPYRDIYPT